MDQNSIRAQRDTAAKELELGRAKLNEMAEACLCAGKRLGTDKEVLHQSLELDALCLNVQKLDQMLSELDQTKTEK